MRLKLTVDSTGVVTTAPGYLAPGPHPARDSSVVEVHQIPHGTPPAAVIAAYSRRIVNAHPYGPFRVSWAHLVKLTRPTPPDSPAR